MVIRGKKNFKKKKVGVNQKLNIFLTMRGHFSFRSINITESFGLKYLPKQWGVPPAWEVRYLSGFLGHFTHLYAHTYMQKNPKNMHSYFPTSLKKSPTSIFT